MSRRADNILLACIAIAVLAFVTLAFISATSPEHLHAALYLPM